MSMYSIWRLEGFGTDAGGSYLWPVVTCEDVSLLRFGTESFSAQQCWDPGGARVQTSAAVL